MVLLNPVISIFFKLIFRNLQRIYDSGILTPMPLLIKENILIMEMIGGQYPAKRLRDKTLKKELETKLK